ncbi:PREDICTED: brain-specific angiogenesis inhibitor 1-like [Priapulus caudatus]|uniref:Brain-specific angiogenesis inhibitor 1-like n=1 Tax=Priapulus caudatus TaxID=37621 RepID=A0ABM1DN77_PRICU|nr:PREDICTED: brain-specific angiogenesis inhibitor 1-like [Priapulus caudatus]
MEVCQGEVYDDVQWPQITIGDTASADCKPGYAGVATRYCGSDASGNATWSDPSYVKCSKDQLNTLLDQAEAMNDGYAESAPDAILDELATITTSNGEENTPGDLTLTVAILNSVTYYWDENTIGVTSKQEVKDFVSIVSDVSDLSQKDNWGQIDEEVSTSVKSLLTNMESLSKAVVSGIKPGDGPFSVTDDNLALYVEAATADKTTRRIEYADYIFPNSNMEPGWNWVTDSNTTVTIRGETLSAMVSEDWDEAKDAIVLTSTMYRTMHELLSCSKGTPTDVIVSFLVDVTTTIKHTDDLSAIRHQSLLPPAKLDFLHQKNLESLDFDNPVRMCSVLADNTSSAGDNWLQEGCKIIETGENHTVCECEQTGTFAIQLSDVVRYEELNIVTLIGAIICIVSSMLTIVYFMIRMSSANMDENNGHIVSLCVSLTLANGMFIAGVYIVPGDDVVCKLTTVALMYLYLVVFTCLIPLIVQPIVSITYDIHQTSKGSRSIMLWLIALTWVLPGIPTAFTAVFADITSLHGKLYCWLSLQTDLMWATIGPIIAIYAVSFVLFIGAVVRIYGSDNVLPRLTSRRATYWISGFWILFMLLYPTWQFGVIATNDNNVVIYHWLYGLLNSILGIFIFLYYAVLNPQINDAPDSVKGDDESIHHTDTVHLEDAFGSMKSLYEDRSRAFESHNRASAGDTPKYVITHPDLDMDGYFDISVTDTTRPEPYVASFPVGSCKYGEVHIKESWIPRAHLGPH